MLPIFPLDLVVFPGMPVPLYVFEERYKRLVRRCLESDDRRFVIALADSGPTIHDDGAAVASVGSYVTILQSNENADGTFRILGHGQDRCRVEVVHTEWVPEGDGSARPLHFTEPNDAPLGRSDPNLERLAAWDTLDAFRRYASTFFAFEAREQIDEALPDDLLFQASFICANLRIEREARQALLEAETLIDRFERARAVIEERVASHQPLQGDPDEVGSGDPAPNEESGGDDGDDRDDEDDAERGATGGPEARGGERG